MMFVSFGCRLLRPFVTTNRICGHWCQPESFVTLGRNPHGRVALLAGERLQVQEAGLVEPVDYLMDGVLRTGREAHEGAELFGGGVPVVLLEVVVNDLEVLELGIGHGLKCQPFVTQKYIPTPPTAAPRYRVARVTPKAYH